MGIFLYARGAGADKLYFVYRFAEPCFRQKLPAARKNQPLYDVFVRAGVLRFNLYRIGQFLSVFRGLGIVRAVRLFAAAAVF